MRILTRPRDSVWTGDIEDTVRGHRGHWSDLGWSDWRTFDAVAGAFGDGAARGVCEVGVGGLIEQTGTVSGGLVFGAARGTSGWGGLVPRGERERRSAR